jgi:hypoxanthine-DNA glycosylase
MEKHPFGSFVPKKARYLLLGSFTGKQTYDWFYGTKRNQFWLIIEKVYDVKLNNKLEKQVLFTKLNLAITDIILSCERKENSNLDNNLVNIAFNTQAIKKILRENKIKKIFFTSRFVEKLFLKQFKETVKQYPEIKLVTLPSPSPRYAKMKIEEKIKRYKALLSEL